MYKTKLFETLPNANGTTNGTAGTGTAAVPSNNPSSYSASVEEFVNFNSGGNGIHPLPIVGNGDTELVITKTDSFQVHGVNLQQVSNNLQLEGNNNNSTTPPQQQTTETNSNNSSNARASNSSLPQFDDSLEADSISTTWSASEIRDLSTLKKEMRMLNIFNFLVSTKFMTAVYLTSFLLGFVIWAILGGIDESLNSKPNESRDRIFVVETSMFEFTHGCSMTIYTVITVGLEVVAYVILELIFLALVGIKADKDTWGIKKESLVVTCLQLFSAIMFIVSGSIEAIAELVDYYVPYGFFIWGYMYLELFICVTIPVLRSIHYDYKKKGVSNSGGGKLSGESNGSRDSNIERVLKNRKMFKIMLDFGRRSYCTESIQCWKDIQRYKRLPAKHRKKMANHILQVYLSVNSPLELNISKIEQCKSELLSQLNEKSSTTTIGNDLFHSIEEHCLLDMTDLFKRLKNANKEFASFVDNHS